MTSWPMRYAQTKLIRRVLGYFKETDRSKSNVASPFAGRSPSAKAIGNLLTKSEDRRPGTSSYDEHLLPPNGG